MQWHHIFFFLLKFFVLIQFMMVILNKGHLNSKIYIVTEIAFKTSLAIFIQFYMYTTSSKDIVFEDKIIFSFAAGLLLYDAWINDFPLLLKALNTVNVPRTSLATPMPSFTVEYLI